jgi:hypothetical protein
MSQAAALLANPAVWKAAFGSIGQSPIVVVKQGTDDDPDNAERTTSEVKGSETDRWVDFANYYAVQLVGLVGLLAGIIAFFVMAYHPLAETASCFVMLFGILVGYQKTKLVALGDFRGQHNALKSKVEQFHDENRRLKTSIDTLAVQTLQLKQVETKLDQIATASGQKTDALVAIVQENGRLQREILQKLQSEVTMQIMTAILTTDRDQNFILSAGEVNQLVMRLQSIPGVEFHENAFRNRIGSDTGGDGVTLADVCAIVHSYLTDDVLTDSTSKSDNADRIFSFRPRSA